MKIQDVMYVMPKLVICIVLFIAYISAFAYYPSNVKVHYKCYKNKCDPHTCPVTGQRFDAEL